MELNEYQKRAMTTCMESSNNILYMMMNLIGEVGEACEKLKAVNDDGTFDDIIELADKYSKTAKALRKGDTALLEKAKLYDQTYHSCVTPEQEIALFKEVGDVGWQWSGLISVLGWEVNNVAWHNILKLADRKKRDQIDGDGDNR